MPAFRCLRDGRSLAHVVALLIAWVVAFPSLQRNDLAVAADAATQPGGAQTGPSASRPAGIDRAAVNMLPPPPDMALDRQIEGAIRRGAGFLLSRIDARSYLLGVEFASSTPDLEIGKDEGTVCGVDALAVYALLQSGLASHDPRLAGTSPMMKHLIEAMRKLPCNSGKATYARGIRAAALALLNRPEDRQALLADANYLLHGERNGAYTYTNGSGASPGGAPLWDNSNSQYGVLGVWSAAEAGFEVPFVYWRRVEDHWKRWQLNDGTWTYSGGGSLGEAGSGLQTMTAAGIATLFVVHDFVDPIKLRGDVGRDPFTPELRKALQWWETGNHYMSGGGRRGGYAIYGVERVGHASGFKFFGTHEWYREVALAILSRQLRNGSWNNDALETSWMLIVLSWGRHPVMMNKLRFDRVPTVNNRYWSNRPRDLAGLARWSGKQLERPLNWQIVNLERDWPDWTDSPILYIASHRSIRFDENDYAKLRGFVRAGGMLFLRNDGEEQLFAHWAADLCRKLFPEYELQDVPPDHPLYSVNFRFRKCPPLKAISNGARLLAVICPQDLARYWHMREDKLHPDAFRLGLNLFLYAGGKRDWRNKLDAAYLPEPDAKPVQFVTIARLKYAGNWDPEPYAWERERRAFQYGTAYGLNVRAMKWTDLTPADAPIAHITGTARYDPNSEEIAAMKQFVEAGGVVLIDSCGGPDPFTASMRKALAAAFPDAKLQPVLPSHPLLNAGNPGMIDLTKRLLRLYVTEKMGADFGGFEILAAGKGHVILSPLDVTSGLLGTNTWGIWGWDTLYSQAVVRNLIFWTLDGQTDGPK